MHVQRRAFACFPVTAVMCARSFCHMTNALFKPVPPHEFGHTSCSSPFSTLCRRRTRQRGAATERGQSLVPQVACPGMFSTPVTCPSQCLHARYAQHPLPTWNTCCSIVVEPMIYTLLGAPQIRYPFSLHQAQLTFGARFLKAGYKVQTTCTRVGQGALCRKSVPVSSNEAQARRIVAPTHR